MGRSATKRQTEHRRRSAAIESAPQIDGVYVIRSKRTAVALSLLSLVLQSLVYPPMPLWPLAFVCLVPWVLVVVGSPHAKFVYLISYLLGFMFYLVNLYWMYYPTGLGQVALSAYLAAYYPLIACALRHAGRRRRIPMALALPFVWVGAELIRALLLTGFPWFLLAHSVYRFLSLIQISDLTGAYGVSFVIAALNGAVADAWMRYRAISKTENTKPKTERQRRAPSFVGFRPSIFSFRFSTVWALGLLVVALVYGQVQLQRHTQSAGPRVAILQGDYPNYVDSDASHPRPEDVAQFYFALMQQAQAERPDLYLLPESPWFMFLNREFLTHDPASLPTIWRVYQNTFQMYWDEFSTWAQQNGAYVVTGAASLHFDPYDLLDKERKYNSAFIFAPDGQPPQRYDKVHVVPFGETIPFRFGRLRFLYLAINDISPFGQNGYEYSMWPGARFDTFSMRSASQDQRMYRFAVPICYEDVMPYVARRFTAGDGSAGASPSQGGSAGASPSQATGKHIDFLLNISNDGWFLHSSELVQHLTIGAFRAVENRVGIARAVNTGVSAFIDANGRIDHTISVGTTGFRVAPVMVDSRFSIYSRIGDAFAWTCVIVLAALYLDYTVARIRGRPTALSVEP